MHAGPQGVSREQNLENLKQVHANLGQGLLMNEHVVLERWRADRITPGIENWSTKQGFPNYGRMDLAPRF
ncbi:MAG: hypothetical protein IPP96_15905 [Chitinophagaceae bacterium]|nr:hypothetical protein [Chitinophagaceae bacterium]